MLVKIGRGRNARIYAESSRHANNLNILLRQTKKFSGEQFEDITAGIFAKHV